MKSLIGQCQLRDIQRMERRLHGQGSVQGRTRAVFRLRQCTQGCEYFQLDGESPRTDRSRRQINAADHSMLIERCPPVAAQP
jgi:hypothetical protein